MPNVSELAARVIRAEHVYLIGNGGSYANACHIANDLIACGIAAHVLDGATLTAIANDFGYYQIFVRWLRACARPGDLLIALSGSGKSPNIIMACEEAERIGMDLERVFGTGSPMQTAEEAQLALGHALLEQLRQCA